MAFPTSPVNGQIYKNFIYRDNLWKTLDVTESSAGWMKFENNHIVYSDTNSNFVMPRIRARSKQTAAAGATIPLLRQFNQTDQWSGGVVVIEGYSEYPTETNMNYGLWVVRWGYSGTGSVIEKISGPIAPVWGTPVTISGSFQYRDLNVSFPNYYGCTYVIKLSHNINEVFSSTPIQASGAVYVYD